MRERCDPTSWDDPESARIYDNHTQWDLFLNKNDSLNINMTRKKRVV